MRCEWRKIDFRTEVIEYRQSLTTEAARDVFDEILQSLEKENRDIKWFYFALDNLGNRSIIQCRRLFHYQPFIEEVDIAVAEYDATREKKAAAIINEDKLDFLYQNMIIPAYNNIAREYTISFPALRRLRELYGEEIIPNHLLKEIPMP